MPDFVNGSYSAAAATIAHAGLKLAPVIYRSVAIPDVGTEVQTGAGTEPSSPVAPIVPVTPGTVLAQSPAAGSRIDARSTIQLTVAQ
jgi:beta-lactam-binding protein with PASTA domain